jgi:hypothetical protein
MPPRALIKIGIHDSIDDALDQTTEIVRADLLYDGEKVRHNSERLRRSCSTVANKHSPRSVVLNLENVHNNTSSDPERFDHGAGLGTRMKSQAREGAARAGGAPLIAHVVRPHRRSSRARSLRSLASG